jgi:hypothetical protein
MVVGSTNSTDVNVPDRPSAPAVSGVRKQNQPHAYTGLVAAIVILIFTFTFQAASGAYNGELAGNPDEPSHFTTGVMVYDYLRTSFGSNPVAFAEKFYVRYPKVAIGHWPPVFYGVQALWYLPFGASALSARILMGLIAAATAIMLFACVRRNWGTFTAVLSTALFFCSPLVLQNSSYVMSDLLVTMFCFCAITSFCSFLRTPSSRYSLAFAAWAILAILTKGNAWSLGIFAILAPLFCRKYQCFKDKRYWIAGLLVAALALPFYIVTTKSNLGYAADPGQLARHVGQFYQRFWILGPFFSVAAPVTFAVALIGALTLWKTRAHSEQSILLCAAIAWIVSQGLFLLLFPLTEETRYFVPLLPFLAILFAAGLSRLRLLTSMRMPAFALAAPVVVTLLALATSGIARPVYRSGYRNVVASIPIICNASVELVSGDPQNEGDLIAETLMRDASRCGIVLRSSKVLADESWSGDTYELRYTDPQAVVRYLNQVPVRYIILQNRGFNVPHQRLLREALAANPAQFVLSGSFPLTVDGQRTEDAIAVYENLRAGNTKPGVVRINMGRAHGNRKLELKLP